MELLSHVKEHGTTLDAWSWHTYDVRAAAPFASSCAAQRSGCTANITKPCVPQNGGCEPGTNVSLWGTAWVVPGCLGAREGKWTPFADSTKTWFCSQETSGAYRWSLPPGTDLTAATAGEGWNASAVNSSSGQACH